MRLVSRPMTNHIMPRKLKKLKTGASIGIKIQIPHATIRAAHRARKLRLPLSHSAGVLCVMTTELAFAPNVFVLMVKRAMTMMSCHRSWSWKVPLGTSSARQLSSKVIGTR